MNEESLTLATAAFREPGASRAHSESDAAGRTGYLIPNEAWWEERARLVELLQAAVDSVNDVVIEARAAGLVVEIDDKGYRDRWRGQDGLLRATASIPLGAGRKSPA